MTVLRRVVTVPLVTALMGGVLVSGPLLLARRTGGSGDAVESADPDGRLSDGVRRHRVAHPGQAAVGERDGDRLMHDFLSMAYAAVRRILDVEVVLDPSSATPNEIPRHEPLIVLSRHCGPGDTVLVAWLLMVEYRLQIRIVLKAILRYEPILDFAEQLGCLCFLARGDRARRQIHDLAASLAGGQAMLLFPEGANFTLPRWRTAIAELRSTGQIRAASRALRRPTRCPHTPAVPPLR